MKRRILELIKVDSSRTEMFAPMTSQINMLFRFELLIPYVVRYILTSFLPCVNVPIAVLMFFK
jgi:hypothetical protein